MFISDIPVFVLKSDVKLQPTNQRTRSMTVLDNVNVTLVQPDKVSITQETRNVGRCPT